MISARNETNSLAVLRPDLMADWDYSANVLDPNKVSVGADRYAHWKCHVCGHAWRAKIFARSQQAQGCPEWESMPHPGGPIRPKPKKRLRKASQVPDDDTPLEPPVIDPAQAVKDDPDFPFD